MQTIEDVLDAVTRTARTSGVGLEDLVRVASEVRLDRDAIEALVRTDAEKPYGRKVLLADRDVESMIARWTPAYECAPHDHGGSFGAVRVLQGRAIHTVWAVRGGRLVVVRRELVEAGHVLRADRDVVHSMADAGGELPLTTLHLYIDPIDHMFVYEATDADGQPFPEGPGPILADRVDEVRTGRTWVVDGGCGAWFPRDEPHLVRDIHDGLLKPDAVRATWAIGA